MKNKRILKLIFLAAFPASLVASCEKDLEPITKPVYDVIMLGSYNILDSVPTIEIVDSNVDSQGIYVYFSLITGNPANDIATGSIYGLPKGVSLTQSSHTGVLPFNLMPKLTVRCDTGTYEFTVSLKTATKGTQTCKAKLHVLPPENYATCMAGSWNSTKGDGTGACVSGITPIDSIKHWAIIRNVSCLGDSIAVWAHFSLTSGIIIPRQTTHGYTIYGRTNYCPCGFQFVSTSIPDTIIHNGDTQKTYLSLTSRK